MAETKKLSERIRKADDGLKDFDAESNSYFINMDWVADEVAALEAERDALKTEKEVLRSQWQEDCQEGGEHLTLLKTPDVEVGEADAAMKEKAS